MTTRTTLLMLTSTAVLLAGCASQSARDQPESGANAGPAVAPQVLEKKFQEAAKGYKVVEKDGRTLYCKREKVIGSTIPTLQCMTEAQLRLQVENMEDLRGRMRNSAKCTLGRSGGGGGCGGS